MTGVRGHVRTRGFRDIRSIHKRGGKDWLKVHDFKKEEPPEEDEDDDQPGDDEGPGNDGE